MTAAIELIRKVEGAGASIRVEGGALVIAPKDAIAHLVDDLRQHKAEVISFLRRSAVDTEAWREPFAEWLTSRCAIHPRCNAGLNSLLAKYSEWEIDHVEVPVAPTREVFIQLLAEHGFSMAEAYGTVLVSGLAFCEDIDAILGIRGRRIGIAGRRVRNVA
jgi:hypothetical protein